MWSWTIFKIIYIFTHKIIQICRVEKIMESSATCQSRHEFVHITSSYDHILFVAMLGFILTQNLNSESCYIL
jgi:hypothetical protein